MAGNTFGSIFTVTTYGESHGVGVGVIIDGVPAGVPVDAEYIQKEMDRRKPGQSSVTTPRKESDKIRVLSGVFQGISTGTPIAIALENENQRSQDYDNISEKFRPGHADYTYLQKYGIRDHRGSGRASGRETAGRVAAGAIAKKMLEAYDITITAYTQEAAGIACESCDVTVIEQNPMRACDLQAAKKMTQRMKELSKAGDSAGGIVGCVATGVPAGLGEPVFDKTEALLGHAMLSIGAVKGIEFGAGFGLAGMQGSEANDAFVATEPANNAGNAIQPADEPAVPDADGAAPHDEADTKATPAITLATNNCGGTLGGITTGTPLAFRVVVKPTSSIEKTQQTVDTQGNPCDISVHGRHDPNICPRIVPVVEAMTAITLADLLLQSQARPPYQAV